MKLKAYLQSSELV